MDSLIRKLKEFASRKQAKKCIVCEERKAEYCIKGSPKDCYCRECGLEQFQSLDYLEKL